MSLTVRRPSPRGIALLACLLPVLLLSGPGASLARQAPPPESAPRAAAASVPFGVGERAEYQVKLGGVTVGSGSMEVTGVQDVGGHDTYHAVMRLSGRFLFARVDDRFESWIDVDGLFSRRFRQNQRELSFRRNRTYEFYPERRSFLRLDNGETGTLPSAEPLDDVAFLYFVRTLPLRPGDVYEFNRYFKEDGNPVVLRVLRRETIEVPAGTFHTVVVQPIIKTDGLFSEGGKAEVYFTDDARRMLVQMRSDVPKFPGSLSLHLREYRPGQPLPATP